MAIDPATGVISWTPTASGDYDITVNASNGVTPDAAQTFTIHVIDPITLPASVIAYWKLDETAGNTFTDLTGVNSGTGNVAPSPSDGQVGGAQLFDGSTTKIDVAANASFDFLAADNFSVEFWYKGSSAPSSNQVAVSRYISGKFWWMGVNGGNGRARFYMTDGTNTTTVYGSVITDGNWHHVAATRNGTTGVSNLYIDGVFQATATQLFSVDFSSPSSKLEIGSLLGNFVLNGSLDEVAINKSELSPAHILMHYNNSSSGLNYYSPTAPLITSTPITTGTVDNVYTYDVSASGYPYPTYSLTTPPALMAIDPATGVISWTPTASGDYDITVNASNGVTPDAAQTFTIHVIDPITLPASVIAYWKLDETAGNTFTDLTGVNSGTGNVAPSPSDGQVGGAQLFDGSTTKIDVAANASFDFLAADNFSVEFWYKGSSAPSSNQVAVSRYISGKFWWMGVNGGNGRARFYMTDGTNTTTVYGSVITDGNWHHVAATRNGTTGVSNLYIDGVFQATATQLFSVDFSSPSSKLEIGSLLGNSKLSGRLDEVAIHNVYLSSAQIMMHYNSSLSGKNYYAPTAPAITSVPVTTGTVGDAYTYDVDASGYPYPTYSLTTFPEGMTIDVNTGLIQWAPDAANDYPVTVQVSNSVDVVEQSFSIHVIDPGSIPAGLISYWKLDETSGGTYIDQMGINNGIGNVSPTPSAGQVGGAQLFDGAATKIDVPANTSFDFAATDNFSVEFWYKGSTVPSANKVALSRYISGKFWWIGVNGGNGRARFYMTDGTNITTVYGSVITDGNWHHVVATRNGTTGVSNLYVDGVFQATATQLFGVDFSSPSAKLEIGSLLGNFVINGDLDEVSIYNMELSSILISQHFTNGSAGIALAKKNLLNPVFADFNVNANSSSVSLSWQTRISTPGTFTIERSAQNENNWVSAGEVISDGLQSFEFKDASVSGDGKYSYRIKYISKDGGYAFSESSEVELLPVVFSLAQNYPNPFNPSTTIKYQIPLDSKVTITIFNSIGEKVVDLVNEVQSAGSYVKEWNAGQYASGVYLLRIMAASSQTGESFSKVVKMMMLK